MNGKLKTKAPRGTCSLCILPVMQDVHNLAPAERILLAIDTSDIDEARQLAWLAANAGATAVKFGQETFNAPGIGVEQCSAIAEMYGLRWLADAKSYDIQNTTQKAVANIAGRLSYPPFAITIPTDIGEGAMQAANLAAAEEGILLLGVTILSTLTEEECQRLHRAPRHVVAPDRALYAAESGLPGIVVPSQYLELALDNPQTKHLKTLVPGTRSAGADKHEQKDGLTPGEAVAKGATWLVIGRQVTKAPDPVQAFADVVREVEEAARL